MTETLNEKLDKILNKVNSNTGQVLSLAARVKALEEKEEEGTLQIEELSISFPDVNNAKFFQWLTEVFPAEQEEEEEVKQEVVEDSDSVIEEDISQEVLEKLDQVNGDS